jgi:hypothetical protein
MKRLLIGVTLVASLLLMTSCGSAKEEEAFESRTGYPPSPEITIEVPPAPIIKEQMSTLGLTQELGTDTQRMIVRTGDIRLVVNDISATLDQIAIIAEDSGGYVVSSNKWKEQERLVGTITIRVPAERFDSTMRTLREMAVEVVAEETSSKDVTEEYVDLSAKLKNLEATERQLLQIMEKAEEVEDILAVQREITRTRDDIERTKGRMQYLEQTSETSLITVALTQSKLDVRLTAISGRNISAGENVYFRAEISGGFSPYTYQWDFGDKATGTEEMPVHVYNSSGKFTVSLTVIDDRGNTDTDTRTDYITVQSGWNAGNIARSAWKGLRVLGQVLADIFIWVGIFSPVLIVIGGSLYLARRRRRKKRESV